MPHNLHRTLMTIAGLAALAGIALGLIEVFTAAREALGALAEAGYAAYLQVSPDNGMRFIVMCLSNNSCGGEFGKAWGFFYNHWFIVGGAAAGVLFVILHASKPKIRRDLDPATGRWSTVKDLKARGYYQDPKNKEQRGYVGMHPTGKMLRVPERIRFSHTLVIGGPGARKSTGYHWQNILADAKDGWSVIIFDLKYPDPRGGFVAALPYFESLGYNVQLFAPYDEFTHHLPIIQAATEERVAREIAEMIIPPDEAGGGAEFYRNNERRLISGLLMHAAEHNLSLNELHEVMQRGAAGLQKFITGQKQEGQGPATNYGKASEKVRTITSSLFEADPKEQAGLITGMEGKIQFFADERLGNATRTAEEPWLNIDLSKLGTEKTILYVGIPQKHIDAGSGKLLLQLIKRMIDGALNETAYQHGGELPVPVSFYLDEFPSLGRLPNVETNFATMRSRRVAYHLTIQNISQGKAIYGDAGFKSFFTSNFQTILLFPSFIKFEDAQYMSQILGSTMTTMTGESETKGGQHNSSSHSLRESTRPLVTVDEMQTWPANEGIAILNGVPHTRVITPGIWEESSGGVKNPFKAIYDQLDQNLDVAAYARDLMQRSRAIWTREALAPLKHDAMVRMREIDAERFRKLEAEREAVEAARRAELARAEAELAATKPTKQAAPPPSPRRDTHRGEGMSAWEHAAEPVKPATSSGGSRPAPEAEERPAIKPGEGKYERVNPKKAINRLASHIVQAQADVRVKGERQKKEVHEIRVPTALVKQHLYDDEIEFLEKQGTLTNRGKHYRVNREGLKLLDDQWYRFFTKQLPVVTNKQRYNRRDAEQALREQLEKLMHDDVQVNVRVNGGTGQIERLDCSVWALDTDLQQKHQVGWGAHNLLRIEGETAVIRSAGTKLLSEEQREHFLKVKRQQQEGAPQEAPATVEEPAKPEAREEQRDRPPQKAQKPAARREPKGEASPAAPDAQSAKRPKADGPKRGQKRPAAPAAPNARPADAQASPKPVAEERQRSAPPAEPRFEYLLDPVREAHLVRLTQAADFEKLQEWAEANQEQIHGWKGLFPPTKPLGALEERTLIFSQRFMRVHSMPRAIPGGVQREKGVKVGDKVYGDVYQLKATVLNASTEWTVWSEAHGERIPGHPRYEGDPLSGVAYKQQALLVDAEEAKRLFGQEFPDSVAVKTKHTTMVRFHFPDD